MDEKKVPIVENCLGREGLQLIKTSTSAEQETCKTAKGLFSKLSQKFKPCLNQQCYCYSISSSRERVMNPPRCGWLDCKQGQQNVNKTNMMEG